MSTEESKNQRINGIAILFTYKNIAEPGTN
jgi:hypothetical protein